jgi:alpha-tubulin suppressor-like RCC1 family protein
MYLKKIGIFALSSLFWVNANAEIRMVAIIKNVNITKINQEELKKPEEVKLSDLKSVLGAYYSYGIGSDNMIYATGDNQFGQLAIGNKNNVNTWTKTLGLEGKNIKQISAGGYHGYALTTEGELYGAGWNSWAKQLGEGSSDSITWKKIFDNSSGKVIKASAGETHGYLLTEDGKVFSAGSDSLGQRGGNTSSVWSEMTYLTNKKITDVFAVENSGFAISRTDDKVYVTGNNGNGELGLKHTNNVLNWEENTYLNGLGIISITSNGSHVYALSSSGKIYATGNNINNQLGYSATGISEEFKESSSNISSKVIQVEAGVDHGYALTDLGEVFVIGGNSLNQIGQGAAKTEWTKVLSLSGIKIKQISAGDYHAYALTEDDKVYMVGHNNRGQLGEGTNNTLTSWTYMGELGNF